jgi:hypothetical protein
LYTLNIAASPISIKRIISIFFLSENRFQREGFFSFEEPESASEAFLRTEAFSLCAETLFVTFSFNVININSSSNIIARQHAGFIRAQYSG